MDGTYTYPFAIDKNDITIIGFGHVVFEKAAHKGKGFIVSQGNNLTIKNIECRFVAVKDKNGACVRQEGVGLTLEHVYFHHSENGILETAKTEGSIYISDSRFEQLGKAGRAHGIYSNKARLYIQNSLFLATKDEGHAIKNRGQETYIANSLISSMEANDSRLIDISNGGLLTVHHSFLHQGHLSVNGQAIGYGLEGIKHEENKVVLTDNIMLLERIKKNILLAAGDMLTEIEIKNNLIVNKDSGKEEEQNYYFSSRSEAGMPEFPFFPASICQWITPCPLLNH